MAGNGDVYKKCFNGTCAIGVNKKVKGSIAKKAEAYLHAVEQSQRNQVTRTKKSNMPRLEVVSRVAAIPIVESGIGVTEKLYFKIRESNPLVRWYLSLGEKSLATGMQLAMPAVQMLETPIQQLDRFLCKSLDVVEKRVPSIYLPPQAAKRSSEPEEEDVVDDSAPHEVKVNNLKKKISQNQLVYKEKKIQLEFQHLKKTQELQQKILEVELEHKKRILKMAEDEHMIKLAKS